MHIAQKVSPAPRNVPLKTITIASIITYSEANRNHEHGRRNRFQEDRIGIDRLEHAHERLGETGEKDEDDRRVHPAHLIPDMAARCAVSGSPAPI